MILRWNFAVILVLLACRSARPDTITMKDNLSINGSLMEMSNGTLKIRARFPSSEDKEMWIPVNGIESIEFNLVTLNPGSPPKIVGFGPPIGQDRGQKESLSGGVIVLRAGSRQSCALISIDAEQVHCGPKDDISYNRNTVLRIVLESK
jgi:hypothetical protein